MSETLNKEEIARTKAVERIAGLIQRADQLERVNKIPYFVIL
jgi:hypothetical protein